MRLIAKIGYYTTLVFDSAVPAAAVIEALAAAKVCKEQGYGADAVLVPEDDAAIELKLVPDAMLRIAGEAGSESTLIDRLVKLTEDNSALSLKVYNLESKLKAVATAADKV